MSCFVANSGGSRNFEKGRGAEDNLSVPSSFIANAHNGQECGTPCTPPLIVVVGHYAQSAAVGVAAA